MSPQEFDKICTEFLTLVELQEEKLLNWGFTNVESNLQGDLADQILNKMLPLWEEAQQAGKGFDDILENLLERKLIFHTQDGFYRTRFSETIRLLYLMRQRFKESDWATASRLVSDMRIKIQRRTYPKRDITLSSLLELLTPLQLPSLHLEVIRRLLTTPDGNAFRVARFQQKAIERQLRLLDESERGEHAVVIGAGTGAGKTKAFYIPALAYTAHVITPQKHNVVAMAIYPRVELLKDQLAEAFLESRKLDKLLKQNKKRPISIGAYYGDTPVDTNTFFNPKFGTSWDWSKVHNGWVCPFLKCPDCNGELLWKKDDVQQFRNTDKRFARLTCTNPECGYITDPDHILLTRQQMIEQPPDILFTTTEMLNQRLGKVSEHELFGIGANPPPRLMLLDEIHTYEGLNGAQVAYLLRRWRRACGYGKRHPLCIVGLSATLTQAEQFFSKLTGIIQHQVHYIRPEEADLEEEGAEYNVVLKGDPVSKTALLSTSIQSAMLLGRILDPIPSGESESVSRLAYAPKIFAFSDKLDIVNRWYNNQYDAEVKKTLSQYRIVPDNLDDKLKKSVNRAGQDWRISTIIGNPLDQPLRIERTTSQDRGVNSMAKLVIATSTLEVGFNDPNVGAVIQHKTPHSMASFLQRKGRAGRDRRTRPWMLLVTSAYGRDRWAFQHAETLFSPLLPPNALPIENYYVRKIQAVYVLMDWLAQELKQLHSDFDAWRLLSSKNGSGNRNKILRERVVNLLKDILDDKSAFQSFERYLSDALSLGNDRIILHSLLWGYPRPLMFEVIPTIIRELETDWSKVVINDKNEPIVKKLEKEQMNKNPMPDFIPPNLFSDLNLPEIRLVMPPPHRSKNKNEPIVESLTLLQAMTEFVPGKANARFSIAGMRWLALPADEQLSRGKCALEYLKIDFDKVPHHVTVKDIEYAVYRPLSYTLDPVPSDISLNSTAFMIWLSHFEPSVKSESLQGKGTIIRFDKRSRWYNFVKSIEAFTHVNNDSVTVTRLAVGADVSTQHINGPQKRNRYYFEDFGTEARPAAIGFTLNVDGLKIEVHPLDVDKLQTMPEWKILYASIGQQYFLEKLKKDSRIQEERLSSFEIEWLWQLELSMLVATAVAKKCTLLEASQLVSQQRIKLADRTLKAIFQSQVFNDSDEADSAGRLHDRLIELISKETIEDALIQNSHVLWNSNDEGLYDYLQELYMSSVASSLYAALTQFVEDIDPDDLIVDVDGKLIWITEAVAGGVGLISKIAEAVSMYPRDFELQLMDTLRNCEREQTAIQLHAVTQLLKHQSPALTAAFEEIRQKNDVLGLLKAKQILSNVLEVHGIPTTRQLIVALNSKFLRPNSNSDMDNIVVTLVDFWRQQQERLGCNVDLRVIAVAANRNETIHHQVDSFLRYIGGEEDSKTVTENQVFNLLQSMLWLTCSDSCPDCIENWQPYQQLAHPSRHLLLALIGSESQIIDYGYPNWMESAYQHLCDEHQVQIACDSGQLEECKQSLVDLLVMQVDSGYQMFFPTIERIERTHDKWLIQIIIRELIGD